MWECTGGSVIMGENTYQGAIHEAKKELEINISDAHYDFVGSTTKYYKNCLDILNMYIFEISIQIEKITRENCPFVNVCEVNAKNNQTINSLFQGMCARMLGLNIEDIGLDITDESIVQITPIKFKFLCLKCH